jgi:hypothetical protein
VLTVHSSEPVMQTNLNVPPGPMLVPVHIQWKTGSSPTQSIRSNFTTMSGKALMHDFAVAAIAALPVDGGPLFTTSEPSSL